MKTSVIRAFVLLLLAGFAHPALAQCPTRPDELPGNCTTGTPLTDGVTVNTGEQYYVTGGTLTVSNVNLNGGTIKVCGTGTLNINGINFNSGRIVNLGNLNINTDIALQGSLFSIFNGIGASMNMPNNKFIINSEFINLGNAAFQEITINGQATICLGHGSSTETVNLVSNPSNAVAAPNGPACFRYNGTALMNGTFTGDAGLVVCAGPDALPPAPFDFGAATVTTSCISCTALLPVSLVDFKGAVVQKQVHLQWATATESNSAHFIIERSPDGIHFGPIGQVAAGGQTATLLHYGFIDPSPMAPGINYYRLKLVDLDGRYDYSPVITIKTFAGPGFTAALRPNPVHQEFTCYITGAYPGEKMTIELIDLNGRIVYTGHLMASAPAFSTTLPRPGIAAGLYAYRISAAGKRKVTQGKIVFN